MENINADMQKVLDAHEALGPLPIDALEPFNARNEPTLAEASVDFISSHLLTRVTTPAVKDSGIAKVSHTVIPNGDWDLLARVYTPEGVGPFPILVYYHGGGWVIGDLFAYDASCRALCDKAACIVVSVAYRQAPEYTFPTAHTDAYAAVQWVMAHAADLGGDPTRIAIGGESAGANLATAACLMARDKGGLMPIHQLLIYPITDLSKESPTYEEFVDAKPLNAAMMRWFKKHYLTQDSDASNPYVSPLLAESLGGLPQATVITAEIDPLRHEAEAYAKRLSDEGLLMSSERHPGVTHEFFGLHAGVAEARKAVDHAAEDLRAAFALHEGSSA